MLTHMTDSRKNIFNIDSVSPTADRRNGGKQTFCGSALGNAHRFKAYDSHVSKDPDVFKR